MFRLIKRGVPHPHREKVFELLEKNIPKDYDPGFNFIVVQKRINTRYSSI